MFLKDKVIHPNTRQYSGGKVVADQVITKTLTTGALNFTSNTSPSAPGVELYVSATGSDNNTGTQASPFATLTKAFTTLSQQTWDGGAQIFVDGAVEVDASNFNTPLTPAPGVSGKPYEISVKGLNVGTEGPFIVQSVSTWTLASLSQPTFTSATLTTLPSTASQGKMVHFLSGALAGLRVPIYGVSGTTLQLVVPPGSLAANDQLAIETHGDSLSLTGGGPVVLSTLSRIPLCIRNLDIVTDGSYFDSNDDAGTLQLLGVKLQTIAGGLFHVNVFGEGLWLSGAGSMMDSLSRHALGAYMLLTDDATLRGTGAGSYRDYYSSVVSDGGGENEFVNGSVFISSMALTGGSRLYFGPGSNGQVSGLGADGAEIALLQSSMVINDIEATGNSSGIDLDTAELKLGGSINLHNNGSYGLSVGNGSSIFANAAVDGLLNGIAGMNIETGSNVRLRSGSDISGPLGAGTDSYTLNGAGPFAAVTAVDTDLTQVGFF